MTKVKTAFSYVILILASFLSAFPLYYMICGTEEALEDIAWGGQQKMHLADWAIVKGGWVE